MSKYHDKDNQDDLHSAIEYNSDVLLGRFKEEDIEDILAEVCGENDELNWYWVISLKNGSFALLSGGCDYTGWDCQSSLHVDYIGNVSAEAAAERAPEKEEHSSRTQIRSNLIAQLKGKKPFALYSEENDR